MELVNILKGIELFRGLSDEQLARLAAISHLETYPADALIFSQGSPGDKMYVIARGEIEVRFKDHQGVAHSAIYLGAGQLFGEMALLDQGERSASVIAVQDGTEVYAISSSDFLALCQADTALGFIMMRNMALDLSFKLRHRNLDPATGL